MKYTGNSQFGFKLAQVEASFFGGYGFGSPSPSIGGDSSKQSELATSSRAFYSTLVTALQELIDVIDLEQSENADTIKELLAAAEEIAESS